jgi:hypothetical protein
LRPATAPPASAAGPSSGTPRPPLPLPSASSQVISAARTTGLNSRVARWPLGGLPELIDPLPGYRGVFLTAITDDGSLAGGALQKTNLNDYEPVIWQRGAGLVLLTDYLNARGLSVSPNATGYVAAFALNGRYIIINASYSGTAALIDLGPCGHADFNHDGDSGTDQDIEAFFACLAGNCCPLCGSADFNGDGDFGTDQDIESFFRILAGAAC